MNEEYLPLVEGRRVTRSFSDFERACLVCLKEEQDKSDFSNSHLIAVLCDAVRLVREYEDYARDSLYIGRRT